MQWVITLSFLQLTRLVTDDALIAVCMLLHLTHRRLRNSSIIDHIEWSVLIFHLRYGRLNQALVDTSKGTLTTSVP